MKKLEKEMLELVETHTEGILNDYLDKKHHKLYHNLIQKAVLRGVSIGILWERREKDGRE